MARKPRKELNDYDNIKEFIASLFDVNGNLHGRKKKSLKEYEIESIIKFSIH